MDLYLASVNIGALWYGIGKPKTPTLGSLTFVIMIAIKKVNAEKFRKDMFKSKRKSLDEIWTGDILENVSDIVRFAPSACNTQPWAVKYAENTLSIYRYKKPGKRGIMPADKVTFYNRIDIGIFMCFMDLCLNHEGLQYEKTLFPDNRNDVTVLTAKYQLLL